jgi:hypothetical protein
MRGGPIVLFALAGATAVASAQNVSAAGQPPPAVPGRFGFSLECVNGCRFVEAGFDHAYFRFTGEPRVSAAPKSGFAFRGGLRVGDLIVDVDSMPITSEEAGLRLASDTVERLTLLVRNEKGKTRTVTFWSPRRCDGVRYVNIANHTGEFVNVFMSNRRRARMLGQVGPGDAELRVPGTDSSYRAEGAAYFYARPAVGSYRGRTSAWYQQVGFRVVCHED